LAAILERLKREVKPGADTGNLEKLARQLIEAAGGRPSFLNYPMVDGLFFPSALCVSINDEVVHGSALPPRIIKAGDIVDLDIGMEWPVGAALRGEYGAPFNEHSPQGGFYTDMCATVAAGKVSAGARKLIKTARQCLELALRAIKPGGRLNDVARAVQAHAERNGYGVVRDLVGHGVGYFAHEEPDVFNFVINDKAHENILLRPGLVIAVEPMLNLGDWRVKVAENGYTILSADGSLSAHFEHTVAVTETGPEILTLP